MLRWCIRTCRGETAAIHSTLQPPRWLAGAPTCWTVVAQGVLLPNVKRNMQAVVCAVGKAFMYYDMFS